MSGGIPGSNMFNVGVAMTLHNGISPALAIISRDLVGMHGSVNQLQGAFSRLRLGMIAVGGVSALIGVGILKGVMHLEKAAESLVHAETALMAGLPSMRDGHPVDRAMEMRIAQTAAYNEAGKNLNTTLTENIEHIHDLYNVVVDVKHAADLLPVFNTLANAFTFSHHGMGAAHGKDALEIANAARAFELTGRTTPETMEKIAHSYVSSVLALRGRVTGSQLLQAIANAGASRYGWSDDFLVTTLPPLVNIMKGRQSAGIGLYHLMNNLYGGVASGKLQAQYQEKWGLHTEAQEVHDPKTGKFQGFRVGSLWNAEMLAEQPLLWANAYREMLKTKYHVNIDDLKTMRNLVQEIGRGNKALSGVLDELLLPSTNRQFNKERGNILGVDKDALADAKRTDPRLWRDAYDKQWHNLEQAMGKAVVPAFIDHVLKPLTNAFRDISQWALRHPLRVEIIMKALTVLGAALAVIGIALVAVAIPAGLIAAPFVAMAAGIVALGVAAFNHWQAIENFFGRIWHWISKIWGGSGGTYDETQALKAAEESRKAVEAKQQSFKENLEKDLQKYREQFGPDAGLLKKQSFVAPLRTGGVIKISLNNQTNLDGRVLARSMTEHMVSASTFQTSVGGQDTRGTWLPPGAAVYA